MNKSFKIVLLLFIILYSGPLAAQKFGYIDSEYILNKHPDYKLVLDELKKLSEEWKKEAQNLDQEIKELYKVHEQEYKLENLKKQKLKLKDEIERLMTRINALP